MSICGVRTGGFILGMRFQINNHQQNIIRYPTQQPKKYYLVAAAND
jgi:hypothetical protein